MAALLTVLILPAWGSLAVWGWSKLGKRCPR